jgi:hypothetical protein
VLEANVKPAGSLILRVEGKLARRSMSGQRVSSRTSSALRQA